ncbi:VanW family protein [Ferdinandcohnia quinoae]|uniref:VanW family protein n=1 Tax=Fredinandcohnia quinoae TaxID=2918902 RepID=A0AAW5E481_9BACI|nr:VanW family protein [Fredinandcohnia sp. SECRCQ15]MCH1627752.1 VanW family protein [Fredinandcohnia sp. SECRCQ15]
MRKPTLFLLSVLLLGGCSIGEEKQIVHSELHQISSMEMVAKQDYVQKISVIDPRTNKVIKVFNPNEFLNEEEYKTMLEGFAKEVASGIDQPMKPAKINTNGELIPGQSKMIMHEKELVNRLLESSLFTKEVELPITETPPNVTEDTVVGLDEVVLGSFTTYFDASVKGRVFNIAKSANEINNIVLGPGDHFYFNSIIGNASKANGYQLATVIVNKEFVPGYGGGVCQTSSTLYNAVAEAGLEILELHHHSKSVGYVPVGKDATVAYGYKDFKFANNRPYPVVLKANVNENAGTIEFQIRSAVNYVSN